MYVDGSKSPINAGMSSKNYSSVVQTVYIGYQSFLKKSSHLSFSQDKVFGSLFFYTLYKISSERETLKI